MKTYAILTLLWLLSQCAPAEAQFDMVRNSQCRAHASLNAEIAHWRDNKVDMEDLILATKEKPTLSARDKENIIYNIKRTYAHPDLSEEQIYWLSYEGCMNPPRTT